MTRICKICQVSFKVRSKTAGRRQYCYDCVPEGLSLGERTTEKRKSAKREALRLLGGKCLKCGVEEPYLIDFHHVDSNEKEGSFSSMLADSQIKDYFKELEKAIPLCANCHRTFHFLEREQNIQIEDFVDLSVFHFHREEGFIREAEKKNPIISRSRKLTEEEAFSIIQKVKNSSFSEVARELGISSSAVQKRLKENGFPYLIKDIKGIPEKKEKTPYLDWRNSPIEMERNGEKYSFETGDEAASFLQEVSNGTDLEKIREGISRVLRGKRKTYLSFKIIKI